MTKRLSVEEEAKQRRLPVELIELERRINKALNQPEFLAKVNEALGWQDTKTVRPRRLSSGPRPWRT